MHIKPSYFCGVQVASSYAIPLQQATLHAAFCLSCNGYFFHNWKV